MKVKNKKYVVALPFLHGMGEAITWLDKNRIGYAWRNIEVYDKNDERIIVQKKIEYIFADEGDALMFALMFAA